MFELLITIEYFSLAFVNDTCSARTETYYMFDNSRGEYYCYVDRDEDVLQTIEWAIAREAYWEASKVKVIEYKENCK